MATENIKYIAKWEGGKSGNPVLFFPEYSVNIGKIACYAHTGQHSEACLTYYWNLRNCARPEQLNALAALVHEYTRNLSGDEKLVQVSRDNKNMRKLREVA